MNLYILGGRLKGRKIAIPKTRDTRPITSLLRKSIFDTCQFFIEGAHVVDLFAGSGAIGIEALSRGAAFATFIDLGEEAYNTIKANLLALDLTDQSLLLRKDAFLFLQSSPPRPFDILFIDPPYPIGIKGYSQLLTLLAGFSGVGEESRIFLEAPGALQKELEPILQSAFTILKEKKSSSTLLYQLKRC